jgi:hypothetical protein
MASPTAFLANFLTELADCLEALLVNKGGTVSDRLDATHIPPTVASTPASTALVTALPMAPRVAFFLGPRHA